MMFWGLMVIIALGKGVGRLGKGGAEVFWKVVSGKMCWSDWWLPNPCIQLILLFLFYHFHKGEGTNEKKTYRMQQLVWRGELYILAWEKKSSDLVSTFSTFLNWVQLYKIELNANVKRFNSVPPHSPSNKNSYILHQALNWGEPDKCPTFSFSRPGRVFP